MKLSEAEWTACLKKAGMGFTARTLGVILDFYLSGEKTYPQRIELIAKLFDEVHDVNIKVTERRFMAIEEILFGGCVVEVIQMLLHSSRLKQSDPKAVERLKGLWKRIENGAIPLLIHDEEYQPKAAVHAKIYSLGDININVTALLEKIAADPTVYPVEEVSVERIFWSACKPNRINHEVAMRSDLSKPLLFLETGRNEYTCVDGFHRLYRAYHEDRQKVSAIHLNVMQYIEMFADRRSYERFVCYWNERLFKY